MHKSSLYKYLREEYAVKMLTEGNIRLGTLYEYRSYENEQIRDIEEGTFRVIKKIADHSSERDGPLQGEAAEAIISMGLDPNTVSLSDFSIISDAEIPNRNIYCTTKSATENVMQQFGSEVCVEIFDANGFFNAINHALKKNGYSNGLLFVNHCLYDGRDILDGETYLRSYPAEYFMKTPTAELNPAFATNTGFAKAYWTKAPFYKPQDEFRAVIKPVNDTQNVEPIIISIPEIIPFIRRHTF